METCTFEIDALDDITPLNIPHPLHPSFNQVYKKLKKWKARFPFSSDNTIINDLLLFYLLATKSFLDHRSSIHLFRLALSVHNIQKKLLRAATFSFHLRHLEIRWMPTNLIFPFSSKPVLGCLIGFNLMDRYEVFDEENVLLALQKHLPELTLVKESSYLHASQHKNLKIFYLEIEKKNFSVFTVSEQKLLKAILEDKVRSSIQTLSPNIFIRQNDEEFYKNILVLSQEIHSPKDLPQAYITFDQQTGKEIVFRIILVHISPSYNFSLKERFEDCNFVLQRDLTIRHLENHPIQAQIFSIQLSRDPSLLRSDGSLDFYCARQAIVNLMKSAIGEFRDYNGGIIIKQQELLHSLKEDFSDVANQNPELLETFFYEITPVEKQVMLSREVLSPLFSHFYTKYKEKLLPDTSYSLKTFYSQQLIIVIVQARDSAISKIISEILQTHFSNSKDIAYNFMDIPEGFFFNCALLKSDSIETKIFIQSIQDALRGWSKTKKDPQTLRIGLENALVSLDPRIGGETLSLDVLRLLFEGLTRLNQTGGIENAVAESIHVSKNGKEYLFKLRTTFWNDGSKVTAYDFEYAWKKILSPEFKTSFAYFFYPIVNAKEAKAGLRTSEEIGIKVIDDLTLQVSLTNPTPYFLQLTAYTLYSPVNRLVDCKYPQWPYQSEKQYPCNGPFYLKINRPSQGYQLLKNPLYWDANNISLSQITLTHMTPSQAYQAFQKKELDWIGNPLGSWHSFYNPGSEDRVITIPKGWVCWCVFNTAIPPFNNRKLRQAFANAVQRSIIISESFLPLTPAFSPLLSQDSETPHPSFPDYDKEKAIRLFNEGLEELGLKKENFPTISLIFNEKGIRELAANCLQKQFKECFDINFELKPFNWSSLFHNMTSGDFQIGLMHWTSWVDDPIYTLNTFKSAEQEINFPKWQNSEFHRLLELSDHEINTSKRSSYLLQAETILCEEMPIVPLFYQPHQTLVKKDLAVTYKKPTGPFNIATSLKKGKRK